LRCSRRDVKTPRSQPQPAATETIEVSAPIPAFPAHRHRGPAQLDSADLSDRKPIKPIEPIKPIKEEICDSYLALPSGVGSLSEIAHIWAAATQQKPLIAPYPEDRHAGLRAQLTAPAIPNLVSPRCMFPTAETRRRCIC